MNLFSPRRIRNYIYDPAVDLQDRSFMLFSALTLLALYAAVPCGIIMREPLSATISTIIGAICFTIYVAIVVKFKRIARAKIVLSIVVVFGFLPAMFFTNGGVYGGAPIWLLLGTIYIALILEGKMKAIMMVLNAVVLTGCWIVSYLNPDLVEEYSRGGNYFDSLAALYIVGAIVYVLIEFQLSLYRKEEENNNAIKLFQQTATALVGAIDAKDKYTHGHSARVAEYSKKIAQLAGKSPRECEEIYYVALLHDVGKIGIPQAIINKVGKLTKEEYEIMKHHPMLGAQILQGINEYPSLMVGARYHHERYDGKGYPDKLKGEDIPEVARIISVADAYDAMTSKRSYRETIPQTSVREEIVKGSGTQFDPKFAKIMQHLIDMDTEYEMKEKGSVKELSGKNDLFCTVSREEMSDGILLTPEIRKISMKCQAIDKTEGKSEASLVLFDSLDGRYHDTPREMEDACYFEFAELWLDGRYELANARKVVVEKGKSSAPVDASAGVGRMTYEIEAVKFKDHARIKIDDMVRTVTYIVALADSSRYAYIGLTGENCRIYDVSIAIDGEITESDIPRIAEEITYIDGPSGDVPNVQVDGYRSAYTPAIPVTDNMELTFHTKSLPTARLVWHCPYLDLYSSDDQTPTGDNYKEYAFIRLDGENWEAMGVATNKLIVNIGDEFNGWDSWKAANKEGYDVSIRIRREGDKVITTTENLGISIKNITTLIDIPEQLYVCLTGDQCALTNIHINHE